MLQTRSYEMCRSSGNHIHWRKSLFDTVLVYNNKNKPLLRYKFGSVYFISKQIFKIFAALFTTFGLQNGDIFLVVFQKSEILKNVVSERWFIDSRLHDCTPATRP